MEHGEGESIVSECLETQLEKVTAERDRYFRALLNIYSIEKVHPDSMFNCGYNSAIGIVNAFVEHALEGGKRAWTRD